MFTKEDLLARLQNGDTAEQLADEFIAAMNEAEKEKDAIDKAAAEAEALAAEKIKDTDALNDHLHAYISKWYPDIAAEDNPCDAKTLIEMFEAAYQMTKDFEKALSEPPTFIKMKYDGFDDVFRLFGGKPC